MLFLNVEKVIFYIKYYLFIHHNTTRLLSFIDINYGIVAPFECKRAAQLFAPHYLRTIDKKRCPRYVKQHLTKKWRLNHA